MIEPLAVAVYGARRFPELAGAKVAILGCALLRCFGPDKADVIYDCAGNDTTIGQAIRYTRKGSKIILMAVFAEMAAVVLRVSTSPVSPQASQKSWEVR